MEQFGDNKLKNNKLYKKIKNMVKISLNNLKTFEKSFIFVVSTMLCRENRIIWDKLEINTIYQGGNVLPKYKLYGHLGKFSYCVSTQDNSNKGQQIVIEKKVGNEYEETISCQTIPFLAFNWKYVEHCLPSWEKEVLNYQCSPQFNWGSLDATPNIVVKANQTILGDIEALAVLKAKMAEK